MKLEKKNNYPWYKQYKVDSIPPHLEYPDSSVYSFIEKGATRNPNKIAYDYFGYLTSYKDFIEQIHDCAKSLATLGVSENDIVTICMPNTPAAIITFYATNMVGAIANMIHPLSSEGEIKTYLKKAKSKVALVVDFNFEKFHKIRKDVGLKKIVICSVSVSMPLLTSIGYWFTNGRKIPGAPTSNEVFDWYDFINKGKGYKKGYMCYRKPEDIAAILYSGGTTGKSKGIELSNLNFNAIAIQTDNMLGMSDNESVIAILPNFHGFGLGLCFHTIFYRTGKVVIVPRFTPKSFGDLIRKKRPTFVVGVPSLFESFAANPKLKNTDLSFIRFMVSGGDSLSTKLKKRVDEFLKQHNSTAIIREGYGLTECVAACAFSPMTNYKEGTVGLPYPDNVIKIVEINTTKELDIGLEGEICISGPTVMKGYFKDAKETKLVLKTHDDGKVWLHTGDIGKLDEDGYLTFVLRLKRMIITNGYNVYPNAIEKVIDTHPDVSSSTVVGIPDVKRGQKIKAFVVLKKGVVVTNELKESIKVLCQKNIAGYSLPREYEFKTNLPKTLVGKIAYRELEKEKNKS